jgi:F420-dependent methylenetetrahydromethanopterin dehydrogenase
MFANKQKNKETSPDFIVYLSNEDNADETKTARPKTTAAKAPAPVAVASDDIPDDLQ